MSQLLYKIINNIPNVKNLSYLELGVCGGGTFTNVWCKKKIGVDNNKETPATHIMTTDEFFESRKKKEKWDLVFVDADHSVTQVTKDFNNVIKHLNKPSVVFLHDLYPNSENEAIYSCGDGYKILFFLKRMGYSGPYITLNEDFGLTAFFSPATPLELPEFFLTVKYEAFRKTDIVRYTLEEMMRAVKQHVEKK